MPQGVATALARVSLMNFHFSQSSNTLLERADLYEASQYGAVLFTHDSYSLVEGSNTTYLQSAREACLENKGNYTSATACEHYGGVSYIIQYNVTAIHVTPLFQSLADEALVRQATGEPDFNIQATIAPLPITQVEDGFGEAQDAFSAWFLVVLSFPFISGAFASFVVAERQTKAKHLQTVAGVEPSAVSINLARMAWFLLSTRVLFAHPCLFLYKKYWLSTYLWDILNYQIPLWIVVMLMFVFDVQVLTTKERDVFSGVLAILILVSTNLKIALSRISFLIVFSFINNSTVPLRQDLRIAFRMLSCLLAFATCS